MRKLPVTPEMVRIAETYERDRQMPLLDRPFVKRILALVDDREDTTYQDIIELAQSELRDTISMVELSRPSFDLDTVRFLVHNAIENAFDIGALIVTGEKVALEHHTTRELGRRGGDVSGPEKSKAADKLWRNDAKEICIKARTDRPHVKQAELVRILKKTEKLKGKLPLGGEGDDNTNIAKAIRDWEKKGEIPPHKPKVKT